MKDFNKIQKFQNVNGWSHLGPYIRDLQRYHPLSKNEEINLAEKIHAGDKQSLNRLIESNLRFVVSVAQTYANQGVPIEDLINEGNLGIIEAAKRFDGKKNFKFISFAVWWVRQAILKALAEQSRHFRVPANMASNLFTFNQARERLEQKLCRTPTNDELAKECKVNPDRIEHIYFLTQPVSSLDAAVKERDDLTIANILSNNEETAPDMAAESNSNRKFVQTCLSILPKRERSIIEYYYGFNNYGQETLHTISKHLGISRERVRQIKTMAIRRLRKATAPKLREILM